jgi:hypothetical protein
VNFENKATGWEKVIEELKVLMIADKKRTVKNGSDLSEKFVTALKPVKFDASGNFQAIENSKLLNVEVIETCKELLINFLQDVLLLKEQNHFNEVKYVQPLTFVFVQKLFHCVLPEHYPQLTFARKESHSSKGAQEKEVSVSYETFIDVGEEIVLVKGETDTSIFYDGVCVFVWEDKNLCKTLATPNERGQILVEVKACAEDFKGRVGIEAPLISGVETSGQWWTFCFRSYESGEPVMHLSYPVSTIDKDGIIHHNLDMVVVYLIQSVCASEVLIDIIKSQTVRRLNILRNPLKDADEDNYDEDGDESESHSENDVVSNLHSFPSLSLSFTQPSALQSTASSSSSSRNAGRTSGRSKQARVVRSARKEEHCDH